jgi:hypothetical protein
VGIEFYSEVVSVVVSTATVGIELYSEVVSEVVSTERI